MIFHNSYNSELDYTSKYYQVLNITNKSIKISLDKVHSSSIVFFNYIILHNPKTYLIGRNLIHLDKFIY